MKASPAIRAYAHALFEIAQAQDKVEEVEGELYSLKNLLRRELELREVLKKPSLAAEQKKTILSKVLQDRVSPLTLSSLNLLIDANQGPNFADIIREFSKIAYSERNRIVARVVTAVPLRKDLIRKLEKKLSTYVGKEVVARAEVDKSIVGGVYIRMPGQILDATVKGKLEKLEQSLSVREAKSE